MSGAAPVIRLQLCAAWPERPVSQTQERE